MSNRFLDGLQARIETLTAAAVGPDPEHTRFVAHKLAGAAAVYGYADLAEAAWRIERALVADATSDVTDLVAATVTLARELAAA